MPDDISMALSFTSVVIEWRGPAPFHFVPVPDELADDVRAIAPIVTYGWGVIPASGVIGATAFTTSLFPRHGGYLVPLKDAVRRAERLAVGDEVRVELVIGR